MPEQSKYWSVATGSLSSAQQSANQVPSAETSSLHRNRHHWCWAFRHLCWLRRWTASGQDLGEDGRHLERSLRHFQTKYAFFFFIVAGLRMLYRCCKVWSWKNWTRVTQQKKKKTRLGIFTWSQLWLLRLIPLKEHISQAPVLLVCEDHKQVTSAVTEHVRAWWVCSSVNSVDKCNSRCCLLHYLSFWTNYEKNSVQKALIMEKCWMLEDHRFLSWE